jgi:signal transduction histidine kinase
MAAPPPEHDDLLQESREQFLRAILRGAFWLGLVAVIPGIMRAVPARVWSIVVVDAAALGLVYALGRWPGWSYRGRALTFVALSYALGVFFLVRVGAVGLMYFMAFPMLVALFLGVRFAVAALVLNAATLISVGYIVNPDVPLYGFQSSLLKWVVITVNFTLVDGIITMATALMVRRLGQLLQDVQRLNAGLEERVRRRTRQLESANRELEAFAYAVSHDLRSPLGTLDGFSGLLEKHIAPDDARGRHYLQRTRKAVHQMRDLIDAMLVLSRVSRASLQREPADLSEIAQELIASYRDAAPERHVDVEIQAGIEAQGDPRLLRLLLDNLLSNAWKFTSKQPHARITFRDIGRDAGERVYEVSDNGAGFDMAHVDKLFKAFHRLHTHDQFTGTGIGLATVQRIVTRHGGRVWAEAAPNQGATFRFTLGGAFAETMGSTSPPAPAA